MHTLKNLTVGATESCRIALDRHQINNLGYDIGELVTLCNGSIENTAPWHLAKGTTEDERDQLDAVIYALTESLRIIAILISPVLPKAAHGIFDQLNWKMELSGKEERFSLADAEWGNCRTDMLSANRCRYSRGLRFRSFNTNASDNVHSR